MKTLIDKYLLLFVSLLCFGLAAWGIYTKITSQADTITALKEKGALDTATISQQLTVIGEQAAGIDRVDAQLRALNIKTAEVIAAARGKHQTIKESAQNDETLKEWLNTPVPAGLDGLLNGAGASAQSNQH